MQSLFYLGIIFTLGALTEWLSPKLHIPRVVGYLILGLIIGPEILGLIPREFVENSHIITDLALSVIAVFVGASLKLSTLKHHGKEVFYITIFQSMSTFLIVTIGFVLLGNLLNFQNQNIILIALIMGAIATATAPATPLAIVRELKIKTSFTSKLLAVVAFDDAIALIMYTLAITFGITLIGSVEFNLSHIVDALIVIVLSVLLGIVAAYLNTFTERVLTHHKGMETIFTLGLIFIVYSISEYFDLEPLLSAMVMVNTSTDFDLVEKEIDEHLMELIFMMFFIISAMHLNFSAIFALPFAIEAYIVLRLVGKVFGSYLGAVVAGSSSNTKKYMGIALIPQAGVAIGLALSLQTHEGFEHIAPIILNIVIATTLVNELIGPFMTKYSIQKSKK